MTLNKARKWRNVPSFPFVVLLLLCSRTVPRSLLGQLPPLSLIMHSRPAHRILLFTNCPNITVMIIVWSSYYLYLPNAQLSNVPLHFYLPTTKIQEKCGGWKAFVWNPFLLEWNEIIMSKCHEEDTVCVLIEKKIIDLFNYLISTTTIYYLLS